MVYQAIRQHGVQVWRLVDAVVHNKEGGHWANFALTRSEVVGNEMKRYRWRTFIRGQPLPFLDDEERGGFEVSYGELDAGEPSEGCL